MLSSVMRDHHSFLQPMNLQYSILILLRPFGMNVNSIFLARFILTYGTHIIVGMAVGGQDLLCVKQRPTSPIPPAELKGYLEDLGDCLFSDTNSPILDRKVVDNKKKVYAHRYMCAVVSEHVRISLLFLFRL